MAKTIEDGSASLDARIVRPLEELPAMDRGALEAFQATEIRIEDAIKEPQQLEGKERKMRTSNVVKGLGLLVGVAWLAAAGPANADPVKCQQSVGKETQKFLAGRAKLLGTCEQAKIKGKLPQATDCLTEPKTAGKLAAAETKLSDTIAKKCAGESPASIGFPATCPDLEGLGCAAPVSSMDDVAQCMTCLDLAATDQVTELLHANLVDSSDKVLDKCQKAISKETQTFLGVKSGALSKCLDARLKGKHSGVCPDANADPKSAPGKAAAAIAKAEAKLKANICKACGGPDKVCGGTNGMGGPNDFLPADIGFTSTCPDVSVPGGNSCAVALTSVQKVADCVACVAEFKADCITAAGYTGLVAYPETCDPPPPPPPCSTVDILVSTQFTPPAEDVSGVNVKVNYPGAKLQLVPASVMNETGVSGQFLTSDNDTPPIDGFNDQLGAGLVALPGDIPPGDFASGTYNCRANQPGPLSGEFSCVADVSDVNGGAVSATCSVSVTVNP